VAAFVGAGEGPVVAPDGYLPSIVPMSGKSWKSITDGIRTLAVRLVFAASSNGRLVNI